MYKINLRIIPEGSKGRQDYIYKPLKTLDQSPEVVKSTAFSKLIEDIKPLIEAELAKLTVKPYDLKVFYADATGDLNNTFSFWIHKTELYYLDSTSYGWMNAN